MITVNKDRLLILIISIEISQILRSIVKVELNCLEGFKVIFEVT